MANVLTAVAPVLYSAARIVPRELTGLIGAVTRDFNDQGVAQGDTVKVGISPVMTAASVTPSQTFTAGSDRTFTSASLTLNQFKEVSWNLTAEQEKSLVNGGVMQDLLAQTVQQAIRTHVNAIEAYTFGIADAGASRAYGTAATAPFATTVADAANVRKILVDNGAPMPGTSLVIDTTAGVNLRSLSNLFKVNEAGSDDMLRQGVIGNLFGMDVRESGSVTSHTAGTGASYLINNGSIAVGTTTLTVDGGTGTILAGDVITLQNDTNKYVVVSSVGGASVTSIVIAEPGLRVATVDNRTVTVSATHTSNLAINRAGLCLAVRPALQPEGALAEQMILSDPQTGLSFLLLRVPGNAMSSWYLRCVYDAFVPNSFAIAKLLG